MAASRNKMIREMGAGEIIDFIATNDYTAEEYHLCAEQYRQLTGEELATADFS